MEVLLLDLGSDRDEYNEPIGVQRLAGHIETLPGVNVHLEWLRPGVTPTYSIPGSFDVIGISAQIGTLARLSEQVGLASRGSARVIIGNVLATYAAKELVATWPEVIAVCGEGETAFRLLCERIGNNATSTNAELCRGVSNVAFHDGTKVVQNPSEYVPLSKLSIAPRPFLAEISKVGGIARVEASRGCHWGRCDFCSVSSRLGFELWRPFPISDVVSDLAILSRNGIRSPYFTDEDFFGQQYERSAELAAQIMVAKRSGRIDPHMNFFASILASDLRKARGVESLQVWREAGMREIFVGVEAGADVELKRFHKKATPATNQSAVHALVDMGFQVDIGSILFEPLSRFEDVVTNVQFLRSLPLQESDSRVVKALRIQPLTGTPATYAAQLTGELDLNSLTYPYRFADDRVEAVWGRISKWLRPLKSASDSVVAKCRGEVQSEVERLSAKKTMARVRDVELDALQDVLECEEGNLSESVTRQRLAEHAVTKLRILEKVR